MSVRLHQEAEAESQEAARWYDQRKQGMGERFLQALAGALEAIERTPRLFSTVPEMPAGREVRRILVERFPYAVIYEVRGDEIIVLAVSHTSRHPDYWKDRNGGTP
jgi:toxin ParE1/3/4